MKTYLFTAPYRDELITSWIARNALNFGLKPSELMRLCTDDSNAWKADIDVFLPEKRIRMLSNTSGINKAQIKTNTFYWNCGTFYSQTGETPQVKWVMPLGVRAKGKHFGLQFCPCCLIEDGEQPYFRKHWRLGIFTSCVFHGVQLHDCCPNCQNPINIKRPQKRKGTLIFQSIDMVHCSICGYDLRVSPYIVVNSIEDHINTIHFVLYQNGYGQVGNQFFHYSNLYFDGARRLVSFMLRKPKGRKFSNQILHLLGEESFSQSVNFIPRQSEPETIRVAHRRQTLICLYHLMSDWPQSFVLKCKDLDIFTQDIFSLWISFPYWLHKDVTLLIKRGWIPISDEERVSAINFLEKKFKRKIKDYEIHRLL